MTSEPRKMIDDPVWGEAFQEWAAQEHAPRALPRETRVEVAALLAMSTAGILSTSTGAAATINGSGAVGSSVGTAMTGVGTGGTSAGAAATTTSALASAASTTGGSLLTMGAWSLVPKVILSACIAGSVAV